MISIIVFISCSLCKITVAPLVGAWIEISKIGNVSSAKIVAPLVGAWIEILLINPLTKSL